MIPDKKMIRITKCVSKIDEGLDLIQWWAHTYCQKDIDVQVITHNSDGLNFSSTDRWLAVRMYREVYSNFQHSNIYYGNEEDNMSSISDINNSFQTRGSGTFRNRLTKWSCNWFSRLFASLCRFEEVIKFWCCFRSFAYVRVCVQFSSHSIVPSTDTVSVFW